MKYQMSGEGRWRETFEEFTLNSICCKHNNKPQTNKKMTNYLSSGSPSKHRQDKLFVVSLKQEQV